MAQGNLIFISGGVRSGKSSFAESYAAQVAESKDKNLYYLATSLCFDDEMTKRIKHHQATRGKSIHNWQTIEASKDISEAVYKEHEDSVILLDCLTVWLSNEFYQKGITEETLVNSEKWNEVKQHVMNEIKNLRARTDTFVAGLEAILDHVQGCHARQRRVWAGPETDEEAEIGAVLESRRAPEFGTLVELVQGRSVLCLFRDYREEEMAEFVEDFVWLRQKAWRQRLLAR